jgi:hypothetical protein
MALTRPRGFEGQVRGVSHHGQENKLSTNRPDTLTQTFFIQQLFPCSQTADHTFEKLRKPAFVPEHASGADDILKANSGGITLHQVAA